MKSSKLFFNCHITCPNIQTWISKINEMKIRFTIFLWAKIQVYLKFNELFELYRFARNDVKSKQGRPPRKSEEGAVRCCRRAMRGYNFGFTTAPLLPHFLDPSITIYYCATFTSFLRP